MCYGNVKVTDDQARERAIAVVTALSVANTDLDQFKEHFNRAGVAFTMNYIEKWTILMPQHVACGFKFDEFGGFMDLLVL